MSVKERLKSYIKNQKISVSAFEESIKSSNGYVNSISKSIGLDKMETIIEKYSNLNITWLLTGKGEMILDQAQDLKAQVVAPAKMIPLYDIEAAAGLGNMPVSILEDDIMAKYIVPDFTMAEFMVRVKGSSMYPKYNSGDIIACKMIKDISLIQWGKVYLIHHFEQGAMVKRLFPSENEAFFSCHSDNTKYPPFEVKINDLTNIALVVGVIRLE